MVVLKCKEIWFIWMARFRKSFYLLLFSFHIVCTKSFGRHLRAAPPSSFDAVSFAYAYSMEIFKYCIKCTGFQFITYVITYTSLTFQIQFQAVQAPNSRFFIFSSISHMLCVLWIETIKTATLLASAFGTWKQARTEDENTFTISFLSRRCILLFCIQQC